MSDEQERSRKRLKERLTSEQYYVTQQSGTEAPFTGLYHAHKEDGQYVCVCCGNKLFESEKKYDSGTGWPSFWAPASDEAVATRADSSRGMVREEVICKECGAHLGHVFPDGPKPSGQRFCINSAALSFDRRAED